MFTFVVQVSFKSLSLPTEVMLADSFGVVSISVTQIKKQKKGIAKRCLVKLKKTGKVVVYRFFKYKNNINFTFRLCTHGTADN